MAKLLPIIIVAPCSLKTILTKITPHDDSMMNFSKFSRQLLMQVLSSSPNSIVGLNLGHLKICKICIVCRVNMLLLTLPG